MAVIVFCIFTMLSVSRFVYFKKPLITEQEFNGIKMANSFVATDYVLSLSSQYAPWLYGWTDKKIIAPGLFENNQWTYEEWLVFWLGEDKEKIYELLFRYQKPVYLYFGDNEQNWAEHLANDAHFKKLNNYWWVFLSTTSIDK